MYRAIEQARSQGRLLEALRSEQARELVVEMIARENRIPRFLAARVYRLLAARLATVQARPEDPSKGGG